MMQPKTNRFAAAPQHSTAACALKPPASIPRPTPRSARTAPVQNGGSTAPSSSVRPSLSSPAPAARAAAKLSQSPQPAKLSSLRPLAAADATRSARRSPPPPPVPLSRAGRATPSGAAHRRTPPPLPANELTLLTEYDLIDDEVDAPAQSGATQHKKPEHASVHAPPRPPQPTKVDDDAQVGCFSRSEPPPRPRRERRGALLATFAALTLAAATALFCYRSALPGGWSTPQASALAAGALPAGNLGISRPVTTLTLARTELANGTGTASASPIATSGKAPQKAASGKRAKTGVGKAKPHPKPRQHQALADDSLKL